MAEHRPVVPQQLRRKFARGSPIAVAIELTDELEAAGHPPLAILPRVVELMAAHAKSVSGEQLASAAQRVRTLREYVLTTYYSLHAIARLAPDNIAIVFALMAPMRARKVRQETNLEGPFEILLAEAAVAACARLADDDQGRLLRADAASFHASALSGSPDQALRERGLEQLQATVAELDDLLGRSQPFTGMLGDDVLRMQATTTHAQAVSNLGQAWASRNAGDTEGNLRRALPLFERALTLPERRAAPPQYQHTLQQCMAALRELATLTADVDEARSLFERGLLLANEALALPGLHPNEHFHWHEPTRLAVFNLRMQDALDRRDRGLGNRAELQGKLVAITDAGLEFLRTAKRRDPLFIHAATTFRRVRDEARGTTSDPQAEVAFVHALAARLTGEHRTRLTDLEAEILTSSLSAWRHTPIPVALWPPLGALITAVHPVHVGIDAARRLFALELSFLRNADPPQLAELTRSMDRMHAGLADLTLGDEQRRVFAGALTHRARLRLAWSERRHPCTPAELLVYCDLLGAATYRADSGFYGQGPAHERGSAEAVWRTEVYRARWDVDRVAYHLGFVALVARDPSLTAALTPLIDHLAEVRTIDPHGNVSAGYVQDDMQEALPARQDELRAALDHGAAYRWRPAAPRELSIPYEDDLTKWLHAHPQVAVLLNVPGAPLDLVTGDGAGGTLLHSPYRAIAPAVVDAFTAAVQRFVAAYAEMLIRQPGPAFAAALTDLIEAARPVVAALRSCCADLGVRALVVLSRGSFDIVPWEALFAADDGDDEPIALVHAPTLATAGTLAAAVRPGSWTVLGTREGQDPDLDFGWSALRAAGLSPEPGPDFATFDRRAAAVGVLRLFVHGEFWPLAPLSGFALHAPLSSRRVHFQGKDVVMMDLTGCGRVECWACDSSAESDMLGVSRHEDEPRGLATAFLLAGARSVVGARWQQPSPAAALIAASFAAGAPDPGDPLAAARTLTCVTRRYRNLLARPDALAGGWDALLRGMLGEDAIPAVRVAQTLGVEDLRAVYAWAGWRVCIRDITCL